MSALPILLLGGAALMMMGGGKKTTTTDAPKKKAAPSYGKDSSSIITIYQDGSVRLGKGWESAYLKPTLANMWDRDFEDTVDVKYVFYDKNGWGYRAEDRFILGAPIIPGEPTHVYTYDKNDPNYDRALSQIFGSVVVNYYGHNKRLSEFSDAYPHVKRLRDDIRWMFDVWTRSKIKQMCSGRSNCEARGM